MSYTRPSRLLVSGIAAAGVFSIGSLALAAIISGTSSTAISAHVTYTQLSISKPATVAGDVMLASITVGGGSTVNVTAPVGWTQIARIDSDVNVALISYWKVTGASEPASYTWTIDQQTRAVGGITPYSGVDNINPIESSGVNTGYGTLATTSAITTSLANDEVVALFATDVNKTFTAPAGMTEKYDLSHAPLGPTTAADDMVQTTVGTVGSKSSTIAGNKARNWATQQIALRAFVPPFTLTPSSGPVFDTVISDVTHSVLICDPTETCVNIDLFSGQSDQCAYAGFNSLAATGGNILQAAGIEYTGTPFGPFGNCDKTVPGTWKVRPYLYSGGTFIWTGPSVPFVVTH